jgi:hypothetical protein
MLMDSELFKNTMKLCEFFFEYKIEIVEKWLINHENHVISSNML